MPNVPVGIAIERARESLSLGKGIPGHGVYVARLDRPDTGYYLVWFGAENATIAVAAVDAAGGEVLSHASLPGSEPHLAITAEEASRRVGTSGVGIARLVWRPCRASYSMLSPLWEVSTARGPVYIDQQGHLWTELEAGGPGG
jgi:streptogramin lyase